MGIRGDSVLVPGRPFFWIYAEVVSDLGSAPGRLVANEVTAFLD